MGMSMFILDENRELVGYSFWPWDSVYTPVVGCFVNGRLVETAPCDLLPQPGLDGAEHAWWFRMRVGADLGTRIEQGDSSIRIMRLEDGALLRPAFAVEAPERALLRAEELVTLASTVDAVPLTGFTAFLQAPLAHQLAILYLDVLGRQIDPSGHQAYLAELEAGMPILQLRGQMLRDSEFRGRNITLSNRLGSLLTSPIWTELLDADPIGEDRPSLATIRLSRYEQLDDEAFLRAFHQDCYGREVDDDTAAWMAAGIGKGRAWIASVMVRDAARANIFTDFAAS
jgi:hypothetical protein